MIGAADVFLDCGGEGGRTTGEAAIGGSSGRSKTSSRPEA